MTVDVWASTGRAQRGPAAGLLVQFVVLDVLAVAVGISYVGWLAATTYAVVSWALLARAVHRSGASSFGLANTVTLLRATLVGGVLALVADSLLAERAGVASVPIVAIASVALALDAVDGQVARRTGTSTPLGARFDGEIDAFLILVLSAFVARSAGGWVLAIGAYRYVFLAAGWALPWLRTPLPRQRSRSAIAAVQGVVLVVAGAGVLPAPYLVAVVGIALGLLSWSFGRDVCRLWFCRPALARSRPARLVRSDHQRQDVAEPAGAVLSGAR